MKPIRVCDELSNRPNIHSLKREIYERHNFSLAIRYFNRDMMAFESMTVYIKSELQDE